MTQQTSQNNDQDAFRGEIVSPVQPRPQRSMRLRNGILVVISVGLLTLAGYIVYRERPDFFRAVKIASAPTQEEKVASTTAPGNTDAEPAPRISSTATEEPSAASQQDPAPRTQARESSESAFAKTYTYNDPLGFSAVLPARSTVVRRDELTLFYKSDGTLLMTVEVTDVLLDSPEQLRRQLELGRDITNIMEVYKDNNSGFRYTKGGVAAIAIIRGQRIFYVTDYSGSSIDLLHIM